MLRITIDLAPAGDIDAAHTLAVLEITNVSGPGRASNDYKWRIKHQSQVPEYGYLLDRKEQDALDLVAVVLESRRSGESPRDHHGRRRCPDDMPEKPEDAWTG